MKSEAQVCENRSERSVCFEYPVCWAQAVLIQCLQKEKFDDLSEILMNLLMNWLTKNTNWIKSISNWCVHNERGQWQGRLQRIPGLVREVRHWSDTAADDPGSDRFGTDTRPTLHGNPN